MTAEKFGLAYRCHDFKFDSDAEQLSPDCSQQKLNAIDKGGAFSIRHLMGPALSVDFDDTTHVGCPVILFEGAHDQATSHELAEQWFDRLQAPSKRLVIFADSAHRVMQEQPGRFLTGERRAAAGAKGGRRCASGSDEGPVPRLRLAGAIFLCT